MNDRIKKLRKEMNLSQEKFGELLGITKSGVSDIESGRRKVTDQHVIMLANNGVSEEWLRTGKGNMFVPGIKDKQISAMLADVMKSGEDSFRHRLVSALARLDDEGWDNLEKLIDMISNK